MAEAGDAAPKFEFETDSGARAFMPSRRRHPREAEAERVVLLKRLKLDEAKLPPELEALLLRYCLELPMNLLWYDRARRLEERKNRWLVRLVVALMILSLGLMLGVGAVSLGHGRDPNGAFAMTFFAGGAFTVLQVIALLTDGKAKLSIFWRASADLKDRLYTFEERWAGKGLATGFEEAVANDLQAARAVTRAERLEFFATIRSPNDVLAVVASAGDALRGRTAEATTALDARQQHLAEARRAVIEARAGVSAAEYRAKNTPGDASRAQAQESLVSAQAEELKAKAVLDGLTNG